MPSVERAFVSFIIAATLAAIIGFGASALVGTIAVVLMVLALFAAMLWIARRLPSSLDGVLRRRRALAIAWVVLGVLTVVQTARLSAYMADPTRDWWLATKNEFWSKHMCMSAYFYAADLNRQGEPNVYMAQHYPGLNPQAKSRATVANLSPDDPFQYPPQFLVLPRLAIALSNDFFVIRTVWFIVQALVFLCVAFLLARWYGGSAGITAAFLIPVLWISVPSMLNFQYGQFHVTAIALAVAAFLAFERERRIVGGALLAAAILTKGFPAIVLVPLVVGRRWKDVIAVGMWGAAFTAVAWAVLGNEPFAAFFQYQLPRVRSGVAFAFEEAWPDFRGLLLAGNISVHSVVRKLGDLGLPGMSELVARTAHGVYSLAVIGFAVWGARARTREGRALVWLAVLNLAAMASPAAWGDYVPIGTLWLLTLLASRRLRELVTMPLLVVTWVITFLLPGVVPIGNFPPLVPSFILSILCTIVLICCNGRVIALMAGHQAEGESFETRSPATI
jgi:alpha-1,2-mannosyltransferase